MDQLLKQEQIQKEQQQSLQEQQFQEEAPSFFDELEAEAKRKSAEIEAEQESISMRMQETFEQSRESRALVPLSVNLTNEYKEDFKEKSLLKPREQKIKNPKSRLYAKNQNAESMKRLEDKEYQRRDERAKMRMQIPVAQRMMMNTQQAKDLSELSYLLSKDEKKAGEKMAELTTLFSGQKADGGVPEPPEKVAANRFKIMSDVAMELMNMDVTGLNLFDDKAVADNAAFLERNTKLVGIFRRMEADTPDFYKKVETSKSKKIKDLSGKLKKRIEQLEAVSDVYRVRKLLITNEYYKKHYNDELSMNVGKHDSPEQRYVAKLLRTSYYLAKKLDSTMTTSDDWVVVEEPNLSVTKQETKSVEETAKNLLEADREQVEAELIALEHEQKCMPPAFAKLDLKTVSEKKITGNGVFMSNPTTEVGFVTAARNMNKDYRRRAKLLKQFDDTPGHNSHISVNSKRLHNFDGGDNFDRQKNSFAGELMGDLTDQELVEFCNGLLYSHKPGLSESEQAMAEDMFLDSYGVYMDHMHVALKKLMNGVGKKWMHLHPEDMLRMMCDPKFADLATTQIGGCTNMLPNAPYEFLSTYSKKKMTHMKDFTKLCNSAGIMSFPADSIVQQMKYLYKMHPVQSFADQKKAELEAYKDEIKQARKDGADEDTIEDMETKLTMLKRLSEGNFAEITEVDVEALLKRKDIPDDFDPDGGTTSIYGMAQNVILNPIQNVKKGFGDIDDSEGYPDADSAEIAEYQKSLKSRGLTDPLTVNPEEAEMSLTAAKEQLERDEKSRIKAMKNYGISPEKFGYGA